MAAAGIVVVNSFTYKDAPEEWSQKWHFQGTAPTTPAGWRALCDAFVAIYKLGLTNVNTILRFYCYEDTGHTSVYTYDLAAFSGEVVGSQPLGASGSGFASGDVAYLLRWNTGRTSSRGKPVYLFKYFHGAAILAADRDKPSTELKAAMSNLASDIRAATGSWPGLAGPDGAAVVGWRAETYLTTRTLKRRGRRPT